MTQNIHQPKKQYDYVIVGSGLYGATFAYCAKKRGKKCLVIEKRAHLGGNIYTEDRDGIHVHTYGAHIFHTSYKAVWDFVNRFVPFNRYTNSPVAHYKGKLYNLPFNMNTFYQMWGTTTPEEALKKIEEQKQDALHSLEKKGHTEPQNLEEQALLLVGHDIYETLIKGYTQKQWGRACTELPPFIIKRLPVRFTFDNNYFNDSYQGIPIGGYNKLILGLLDGIETKTSVDFFSNRAYWEEIAQEIVFTGQIDEFFDYTFGHLEYRTVRFETEEFSVRNIQGNAVINYTDVEVPYTRIIEHKHFECENPAYNEPHTIISKEYSTEWKTGLEPFYPVNDTKNTLLYQKYKERAQNQPHTIFGGRLAEYKYYDMDDTIFAVLSYFKEV